MKQNASVDASFWINSCAGNLTTFVNTYFDLFVPEIVAQEVRYPLDVLGMQSKSALLFNTWLSQNKITLQNPIKPVSWFQQGENAAIALAIEHHYFLLIDDANPYHRAKSAGLQVVGSADFAVFLYDQERLAYQTAHESIQKLQVSKKQKRTAFVALETLKRFKRG